MNLAQDLRYALRQIRRSPGFALTAVLTLALSIGATTAIFTFVDGVLLKPLAYRQSGQLVVAWEHVRYLEKLFPYVGPNPRHVAAWRQAQTGFTDIAMVHEGSAGVSLGGDHPRYVGRISAEPNLLRVLGVHPLLGRDLVRDDAIKGHDDRAILSWNLWQTLFGGSADVLGKTFRVGTRPTTVIGVMPRDFYFPKANELNAMQMAQQAPAVDLLTPASIDPNDTGWNSDYGNFVAIGRLKPGSTPAAAQAQLDVVTENLLRQAPPEALDGNVQGAVTTVVQPLKEAIVGKTSRGLWLLFAAVLSVLLIACINLANAQLARVMARDREAAVRAALGASAWNLLQASLLESLLLSVTGGTLGVVLAKVAVDRFADAVHIAIPRADNITLNGTALAAAIACTAGATLLFGALPALRYLRARPQAALQAGARAHGSAGGSALRRWLICGQVLACTALVLLTSLFARNLLHLLRNDQGYSTARTVIASVRLQGENFTDPARAGFDDAVLARLRDLPGVSDAAMVSSMLSQGQTWLDGVHRSDRTGTESLAQYRWISPDYFSTVGQRILEGRALDARDRTLKNAVISKATADAVWPQVDPLGRSFSRGDHTYTVVGIAADARSNSPREAPVSMVFLPYWDNPPYESYFLVHGTQDVSSLPESVQKAIWTYDPGVTIASVRTLDSEVDDALAPERMQTTLLAAFGGAALLLALLGVYGTLNYSVQRRIQEFGIRMALGATRGNVYWITLRESILPIAVGLAGGWLLSVLVGRAVRAILFGADKADSMTSIAVIAALCLAALLATYLPCRRASRVEPMEALRSE